MDRTIREITEVDYPDLQQLHRSVGWPPRSLAGWRWLHDNPFRREIGAPAGWVAESLDGRVAAHVGNLVQRFRLGDRVLHGATGYSIIVSPSVRGSSRPMLRAFTAQAGVFAAWTFNANTRSQPLYSRHASMRPWPEATHALKLSWIVDPIPLAKGRLLRALYRTAPSLMSGVGEQLMNDRLGGAPRFDLPQRVGVLTDLRDQSRYADFWQALCAEGRLLADRSPAVQRWRLQDPDLTQPPLLLSYNHGAAIGGYAMAMMAKNNVLEPPVLEIVDLEALDDCPEAVPALMTALMSAARAMGAAKVRMQTIAPRGLERLGAFARSARREGGWGHCHVRFAPGAPDPALWSPTPYDGDYAFCLRPIPLGERVRAPKGVEVGRTSKA